MFKYIFCFQNQSFDPANAYSNLSCSNKMETRLGFRLKSSNSKAKIRFQKRCEALNLTIWKQSAKCQNEAAILDTKIQSGNEGYIPIRNEWP